MNGERMSETVTDIVVGGTTLKRHAHSTHPAGVSSET